MPIKFVLGKKYRIVRKGVYASAKSRLRESDAILVRIVPPGISLTQAEVDLYKDDRRVLKLVRHIFMRLGGKESYLTIVGTGVALCCIEEA